MVQIAEVKQYQSAISNQQCNSYHVVRCFIDLLWAGIVFVEDRNLTLFKTKNIITIEDENMIYTGMDNILYS